MPPRAFRKASLVEYGVIGDLATAALVSRHGSIDWLCWPRLDSPSLFAALLDEERGGRFAIEPDEPFQSRQAYEPRTNILRTTFETPSGTGTLLDFLPVETIDGEDYAFQELHRILEIERGTLTGTLLLAPRFDYGRQDPAFEPRAGGVLITGGATSMACSASFPLTIEAGAAVGSWSLRAGTRLSAVLRYDTHVVRPIQDYRTLDKLQSTRSVWHAWSERCRSQGPWADSVLRSALTLKLLTYAPTGALSAAATTSLPEAPGKGRNWDYRFSWIRDSAYAMQMFHALGYTREARRYLRWLRRLLRGFTQDVSNLRVCYGLEGEVELPEQQLDHLRGYLDSRPVRIGNAANLQLQHDLHGTIAAAVFDAYQEPSGLPDEAWRTLRALAEHVRQHWREPDHGIWEIRGERRRYTHSALMCWVALDRAARAADARGDLDYRDRWNRNAAGIREEILENGWNNARGSFVQVLDGENADLDAAVLMLPLTGFLPATHPKTLATVDRILQELSQGPFVYRYRAQDGLDGQEGAFLLCSFWMVHVLALAGRVDEAKRRFEELTSLAGPLGLFSEQVDPNTRQALGNFPQALTHIAQVNAALALAGPVPRPN